MREVIDLGSVDRRHSSPLPVKVHIIHNIIKYQKRDAAV